MLLYVVIELCFSLIAEVREAWWGSMTNIDQDDYCFVHLQNNPTEGKIICCLQRVFLEPT